MREKIIVVGAGGHARSMIDSIEAMGVYEIAGFVDVPKNMSYRYRCYEVIGTDDDLKDLYDVGIHYACIGVGFLGKGDLRQQLYRRLNKIGYQLPNIIDPTSVIAKDVVIGEGCFVGKNAIVNSQAEIGNMVILNTGSIVEHDCRIGDYSHVAVGTVICGMSQIGNACLVGANATVIQGISIGNNCVIGAGAIVRKDLPDKRFFV